MNIYLTPPKTLVKSMYYISSNYRACNASTSVLFIRTTAVRVFLFRCCYILVTFNNSNITAQHRNILNPHFNLLTPIISTNKQSCLYDQHEINLIGESGTHSHQRELKK